MSTEYKALIKSLNVPLLTAEDVAKREWPHWNGRERELTSKRIAEEQKQAFESFLADPSPANERQLMLTADVLAGICHCDGAEPSAGWTG
jgi:hypothetical protein